VQTAFFIMNMNKFLPILFAFSLFVSCNNRKDVPDVSGINISLAVQRFDQDFFNIDTTEITQRLPALETKYPVLFPIFRESIVGVSDIEGLMDFYRRYKPVYDSTQKLYADFETIKTQVSRSFQFVKHYFPQYQLPSRLIPVVGPMNSIQDLARMGNGDYTPDFLGQDFIGISLQFYLGATFSLYHTEYFVSNVAPLFRSRRFSKEYIAADVMKLITEDLFPDKSKGKALVEQMIEKGKQWWMLDKFMPEMPDSVKTGYTQQQLEWCEENEGLMWSYLIRNEDLYSLNPVVLQTYLGESPFTAVFSQELSPGNIGQWIGWQIVKKFAANNPEMKPEDIMKSGPKIILEQAKYKPK
jgi:hypothetical protein